MSTDEQDAAKRRESLDIGNAVRQGRAEIRVEVRALGRRDGALRVAEIVKDPPPALRRTYVFQLLQFAPFVADAKAAELLRAADVSPWCKAGRLKVRERLALAEGLERFAAGEPVRVPIERFAEGQRRSTSATVADIPIRKIREPQVLPGPRCTNCGEGPLRRKGLCGWCEPVTERSAA